MAMSERRISLSVRPEQESTFGARLRRLREAAGLTQEELAERAGLSRNAISSLERGERKRPYPHTVRSLAEALGLSEDERAALLASVPRQEGDPPPSGWISRNPPCRYRPPRWWDGSGSWKR